MARATIIGMTTLVWIALSTLAMATQVAYEGFNYTGTDLNGQTGGGSQGFSGPWVDDDGIPGNTNDIPLSNDGISLTTPLLPPSSGSRLLLDNVGMGIPSARRDLSTDINIDLEAEGSVWYASALFRKDSDNASGGGDFIEASLSARGTPEGVPLFTFGLGSDEEFFAAVNRTPPGGSFLNFGSYSLNTTYLIIAQITTSNSGPDEISILAFDPTDTVPDNPVFPPGATGPVDNALGSFGVRFGGAVSGALDEFRLGTTFASVASAAIVPEPTTCVSLSTLLAILWSPITRRQRRR